MSSSPIRHTFYQTSWDTKFFRSNLNVGFGCVAYSWLVLDDLSDVYEEMFKSGKHRDEKKSNYSQEDTDKSDKESLYGVLVFSHLNSTSDRFTSSLEPLLGNWIAKESYLGGKSSQFLIDLNSILFPLCHSRREQFTIDRLQSSSKKSAKFSTHNFQLFLMTFYLNLSPLWKRNFF